LWFKQRQPRTYKSKRDTNRHSSRAKDYRSHFNLFAAANAAAAKCNRVQEGIKVSKRQVLVATMGQSNFSVAEKMNLRCDARHANHTDYLPVRS
jgi:hypothetical protein